VALCSGGWHAEADNGEKVQYLTGTGNGTYDGGYWVVTDPDGAKYYFGLTLPGYSGSAGDTPAQAAWVAPVYCPRSTDPSGCYNSTFASSKANMAWRWQLDYVVDSHGDAMAYLYNREVGYYAPDNVDPINGNHEHVIPWPGAGANGENFVRAWMSSNGELGGMWPITR
jgi:hypothetical protein